MDYLNIYKIYNKKNNTLSDFLDHEQLNDAIMYMKQNNTFKDCEIYSFDMKNVTKYLDI